MSRALFYVDALPAVGELAALDGDDGFHAASVRRIRIGEELDFSDGAGTVAHVVVEDVAKGRLSARVVGRHAVTPPSPQVTVVQALPKSDRSELAIELATEAGADAFVAWQSDRCVARWDGPVKIEKGLRRWQAVARSAARQSRRPHVPPVTSLVSTGELVARVRSAAATSLVLILHESAAEPLTAVRVGDAEALMLIIGPEGGIADDELAVLIDAGAMAVRLGPTVLRTTTAAAVALGALGVLTSAGASNPVPANRPRSTATGIKPLSSVFDPSVRQESSTAGREETTEGRKEVMTMKKLGLAAIVAGGLTAGILGVASPIQAVASAEALPVLELPGYPTGVDHQQWIDTLHPEVTVPRVDTTVSQSR